MNVDAVAYGRTHMSRARVAKRCETHAPGCRQFIMPGDTYLNYKPGSKFARYICAQCAERVR